MAVRGQLYPVPGPDGDPYAATLPRLDRAVAGQRVDGAPVLVTGASVLASGGQGGSSSVLAETLLPVHAATRPTAITSP